MNKLFLTFVMSVLLTFNPYSTNASNDIYNLTGEQWLKSYNGQIKEQKLTAMMLTAEILFSMEGESHCKPEEANVGQAVAVAEIYIKNHPQFWHKKASLLIMNSFHEVWPCASK